MAYFQNYVLNNEYCIFVNIIYSIFANIFNNKENKSDVYMYNITFKYINNKSVRGSEISEIKFSQN